MGRLVTILGLAAFAAARAFAEDPWADTLASSHLINPNAGFTDPQKAIGKPVGAFLATPSNTSVVSLGTTGSYIVLKFDTPVTDDPRNPMGLDCIVFSNAFYIGGNPNNKFVEPALIEISDDVNQRPSGRPVVHHPR